jgi:hypothetical protein
VGKYSIFAAQQSKLMKALLPVLFWLISLPCLADYTTPGSSVKWTLNDLVTNSGGNVTFSSGEYSVSGIITIATNDTLSITSDATVKFAVNTHFLVNGTIIINPPNSVVFTATDQSLGFNGMRLDFSTASYLKKLTLEYAISLNIRDCSPAIDSCIFRYNNNNASTTFGNGAVSLLRCNSVISNCQFLNNKRAAIQSGSNINNAPKIIGCLFTGNNTTNQNVPQINLGASGTDTTRILYNQILAASTNSGGIGFLPIGTTNAVITGNVIKNNRYGITFNGGSNINSLISYNQIDSNNTQNNPSLGGSGIAFSGGSASSHQNSIVTGNIIRWNLWGITIQNGAKPNLGDLSNTDTSDNGKNWFSGNTNASTPGIHLYNNSPDAIMAQGNYWGSNDPSAIEAGIFHQPDNASLGLVDYSTYVLPVELFSFTASVTDKAVQLNWKTSTEINSNYFEVEKSDNGTSYRKLGVVKAAGASSSILNYSYTDLTYDPSTGAFYRLKIIDKDGRYKYSPVINIKPSAHDENVKLFPTVLRPGEQLTLQMNIIKDRVVNIYFYDVSGKMLCRLSEVVIPGRNRLTIKNIPSVPGNLFVKIVCSEFSKTIPVIVQ